MKKQTLVGLIAALSIAGWWNYARAENEPTSTPPRAEDTEDEAPLSEALHEKSTTEAWAAFKAGKYGLAIASANECIERFEKTADGIQTILKERKADLPVGAVSETDRQLIRQYQILHDVATCLLIKAWAAEKQGRRNEAIKAYTKVTMYSYARVSERAGEPYWSPAEVAAQQLKKLSK